MAKAERGRFTSLRILRSGIAFSPKETSAKYAVDTMAIEKGEVLIMSRFGVEIRLFIKETEFHAEDDLIGEVFNELIGLTEEGDWKKAAEVGVKVEGKRKRRGKSEVVALALKGSLLNEIVEGAELDDECLYPITEPDCLSNEAFLAEVLSRLESGIE